MTPPPSPTTRRLPLVKLCEAVEANMSQHEPSPPVFFKIPIFSRVFFWQTSLKQTSLFEIIFIQQTKFSEFWVILHGCPSKGTYVCRSMTFLALTGALYVMVCKSNRQALFFEFLTNLFWTRHLNTPSIVYFDKRECSMSK